MVISLYGVYASPPVRAVLMTLKALDIPYEFVQVNILAQEHLSPEHLERNPQHTVPTLDDDGTFIWDSHAITAYLVKKYSESDELNPEDPIKRAVVDQRLHFDTGVMFTNALLSITRPLFFMNMTDVSQNKIDEIAKVYDLVETFIGDNGFVAADHLTIADFSFISTITSLECFLEIDAAKYGHLTAWIELMKQLPYYEETNGVGVSQFMALAQSKKYSIVP